MSGVSWMIGQGIGQTPSTGVPAFDNEVDYYRWLIRTGGIAPQQPHVPSAPGYTAPEQKLIAVPNSANGTGSLPHSSGTSEYPSIESVIQRQTQALADTFFSEGWTDAKVADNLTRVAMSAAAWLGGLDSDVLRIPQLVAQYVAVFRIAVTPV